MGITLYFTVSVRSLLKTLAGNIFLKRLLEVESVVGKRAQSALTRRDLT